MKHLLMMAVCLVGTPTMADSRISTKPYDSNHVYDVFTQVGRATLIQLEADETVSMSPNSLLGMGDALAWQLGVRGNNISLKPKEKRQDTNLVVVTNKRTYSFDLRNVPKNAPPTYILRFFYADTEAAKQLAEAKRVDLVAVAKATKVELNTEYFWRGDNVLLRPTAAWDDGRFTRLVYDHAGELPVFFKVMPDGSEALINSNIDPVEKNTVVLQEVVRKARARLGDEVIEIVNLSYKVPKFNTTGAGMPGEVRVEKGGAPQ